MSTEDAGFYDEPHVADEGGTSQLICSSVEICRRMGWGVGTELVAADCEKFRVRITALGERVVIVRIITAANGQPVEPNECIWELNYRDWQQAA